LFYDLIEIRVISRIKVFGTGITGLTIIIVYNKVARKAVVYCFVIYLGHKRVAEYYLGGGAGITLVRISWVN
jgi:hypothetical protein